MSQLKEKKKILIVSRSFYPTNSARSLRTTELAKEFSRQGHRVTVITQRDEEVHPKFEEKYNLKIKDLGKQKYSSVQLKGRGLERLIRRVLIRFPKLLFEYPDIELMWLVKNALKNEADHDLMISIAVPYPVHWGVAWSRSPRHKIASVWAADCGDPYVGAENDSFKKPFYFSFVEKWFSRKADYITIPFEGAKAAYFPEFHSKIRIIPQGFTFPNVNRSNSNGHNQKITFAYVGNVTSYQHYAVPFLDQLNSMDTPFKFIIYLRKEDRHIYENALNAETLQKCEMREYVPRKELFQALSHVDFLVHFPYQNETQRSLKLVDYAHMKKPILSYTNDSESSKALSEFMNHEFDNALVVEDPDQYRVENVCKRFLDLI